MDFEFSLHRRGCINTTVRLGLGASIRSSVFGKRCMSHVVQTKNLPLRVLSGDLCNLKCKCIFPEVISAI